MQVPENRTTKTMTCCSGNYCEELKYKALRKKPISIDLGKLLRTQLQRCLKTLDLTGYGIAAMLGGTIFVLTGTVARNKSGPSTFIAYILAGIVAGMNALNYAELACRFPKAGSTYTYVYVLLGEIPAFLAGWSILLEYILGVSTVARGWSSCLNSLTRGAIANWTLEHVGRLDNPNSFFAEELDFVASGLVIVVVITTCFGIKHSSWINLLFTAVSMTVLTLVSVFMFFYAEPDLLTAPLPANTSWKSPLPLNNWTNFMPYGMAGLIAATATCFNAFIGFDMISMCSEEASDPEKSVPRANMISVTIVTLLLSLSTLSLLMYLPWYVLDVGAPFLEAMHAGPGDELARRVLFYVVGVGCLIGIFSNLLTNAIAAPRILYAMGQDGLVFGVFSKVTEPFKTPMVASIPIAVIGSVLALVFGIDSLADFLSLGTLIAYSMSAMGVIILRYRPAPETLISSIRPQSGSSSSEEKKLDEPSSPVTSDPIKIVTSRVGQPGYLKAWWVRCLPKAMVTSMTLNKAPGDVCITTLAVFIIINCLLMGTVLVSPINSQFVWSIWAAVGGTLFLAGLFVCMMIFSMHQQFGPPRANLFRLSMVPFMPCMTIVFNMVLISQLSWMTWVRFLIWVFVGLFIYLVYGVRHSDPSDTLESDDLLDAKH